MEGGLGSVSADATPCMSRTVCRRSCHLQKFWPTKSSIFEISGKGFAKVTAAGVGEGGGEATAPPLLGVVVSIAASLSAMVNSLRLLNQKV